MAQTWGAAILAGLLVAAALIVIPRETSFESTAEAACGNRGEEFLSLTGSPGRYADPVPEGARCTSANSMGFEEYEVDFFDRWWLADLYRLACVVVPLAVGLSLGLGLSRASLRG